MTEAADRLVDYLNASPSPFHACETSAKLLDDNGFARLQEYAEWPTEPGRYYLVRGGTLIAWSTEHSDGPATGFRIVGAHTDSPNLRIKPRPDHDSLAWQLLGVEPYGGLIVNSWLDRDLGLSGRVALRDGSGIREELVRVDDPLLRVSRLAIHLDRSMNDGEQINRQFQLEPHWGLDGSAPAFADFLADTLGVTAEDVLGWDVMAHDLQPATRFGHRGELVAGARQDNLATSCAGTYALIEAVDKAPAAPTTQLLVLFDHEEIGSTTDRGAASSLLPTVLERITTSLGGSRDELHRALARTVIASGDMAHATHPNYVDRHEPRHLIAMNGGPVLKINVNGRYATDAPGAAAFRLAGQQAGVPVQDFVTRSDLPCGSTVGPITSALSGATTVDFGAPTLSMHSIRELTGSEDQRMYAAILAAFLSPA
ncbi:M18 family aminopeptidase [Calidifontibacter sp. DB0510]|uniref:M18 family aminopeptidase n=1 Tax=Metallococcus carri TaxID=1656884 RepID=A0A967B8Y1_9MICO|nr:M18 family aminopeptidase [Metallococcus carri]NHN56996.1 M18 family aminopeptidase [Metallococcus carri]NOP37741.1 M18 family aminopeptidase [Calidifontibacter sp. DB2511S]